MKRIAVFGGSFNPPGIHHRATAEVLARHFDQVIVVPCGPRPDKPVTNDVPSAHRAAMVDLAFRGIDRVRVDLFDLELGVFSRTHELDERYRGEGEAWHVVSSSLLASRPDEPNVILREWARGEEVWADCRVVVIQLPGEILDPDKLPPRHMMLSVDIGGDSRIIRERVYQHKPVTDMVTPSIGDYIERHELYRGRIPPRVIRLALDDIRPMVLVDEGNPKAVQRAADLGLRDSDDPNMIVVVGGDGAMLRAIRREWRRRLPFFGVNAGHRGFLLNQSSPGEFQGSEVILQNLPLLWVEMEREDGTASGSHAFNDAWVERATGQTAWIEVKVNGQVRLQQLVADGVLVATSAGSTSYARAMGAASLPLGTPALLLVGSNVLRPHSWQPAVLPVDSTVEFSTLDPAKRPLNAFIDGVDQGSIRRMRIRVSRVSSVELAFEPSLDPAEKLAQIQFPPEGAEI